MAEADPIHKLRMRTCLPVDEGAQLAFISYKLTSNLIGSLSTWNGLKSPGGDWRRLEVTPG
ncbi:hypothetical protein DPMN_031571 [Dreissena polymorpha]|uniref:Uncharacterized protein n=1 Tax=Dreissena polymorpha TaxID=45954 RepID=A0A9D4RHG2_DREPO|nr:hypothetical protein DPMN_031571 [Dreissena polymorpha]